MARATSRKEQIVRNEECFEERYRQYGGSSWFYPTKIGAQMRYEAVCQNLEREEGLHNVSILDIGCGDGEFLRYLMDTGREPRLYVGTDVYRAAVVSALERFGGQPEINYPFIKFVSGTDVAFYHTDLVSDSSLRDFHEFDFAVGVCVIGGVRNATLSVQEDLMKDLMDVSYQYCCKGCAVTAFSHFKKNIEVNDTIFDPVWMFQIARRLSERVILDTSYAPHDMTVAMFKEKSAYQRMWEETGGWKEDGSPRG